MSDTPAPRPGTSIGWLVGFVTAWTSLAVLGRLLVVGEAALVWPALGLSVTWFLVRQARLLSVDTVVLALAAFATIALVGAPVGVAALGALTNGLQAPLAAALIRRWVPGLDPIDGVGGIQSPHDVVRFSGAVLGPAVLAAALAVAGLAALGEPVSAMLGLLLVGRNLCGGLLLATVSLALVAPLLTRQRPHAPSWCAVGEITAAVVVVLGLLLVDTVVVEAPVGFLVLAVAVWVGARRSVAANVWFAAASGACVVAATLAGDGTFSSSSSQASSLLAQLFVVMLFATCLALATARAETHRLQDALHEAALDAAYRAEFLDLTMATVHEGIMVVDATRAITFVNPEAVRLLGVDEQTGLPRLPTFDSFVVDGVHLSETQRPLARALRGEDVQDVEVWMAHDPPQVLCISARQLRTTGGEGRRAVLTIRDVTSEHVQRTALRTFAGVVAHDLRNPLAAIDGWTEMLADLLRRRDPDDHQALEQLARVTASSARMSVLISELLAYATVKDKDIAPTAVSLEQVIAQIARERGRSGQVVCGPIPQLLADPTLVYQLFDNLIGNALKFVEPGTQPRVVVEAVPSTGSGLLAIEVSDNGVGIPVELRETVFSEFQRVPGSGHGGHGLGLAICRQIVIRHGGTISAHERDGARGTTFRLTLPAAGPAGAVDTGDPAPGADVVDDDSPLPAVQPLFPHVHRAPQKSPANTLG